MPLRLFRVPRHRGANLVQCLSVAGMFGMFFLCSLYLQRVLDYDALHLGLAFFPATALMAVISLRLADRVVERYAAQPASRRAPPWPRSAWCCSPGCRSRGTTCLTCCPGLVLLGAGMGVAFPALMAIAMSEATPEDAGLASGLVGTTAEAGAAVGLAVLATLSATRAHGLLGDGVSEAAALTAGYRLAFGVAAGLLSAATLVALTVLRPRP